MERKNTQFILVSFIKNDEILRFLPRPCLCNQGKRDARRIFLGIWANTTYFGSETINLTKNCFVGLFGLYQQLKRKAVTLQVVDNFILVCIPEERWSSRDLWHFWHIWHFSTEAHTTDHTVEGHTL